MRLGGTYLLQAEAYVDMGDYGNAAASINVLRQRALAHYPAQGMVTASEIQSSGHNGLDFILDERARELLAEENRRETLMSARDCSTNVWKVILHLPKVQLMVVVLPIGFLILSKV